MNLLLVVAKVILVGGGGRQNKNHFKESLNYMIQSVIPHEYAHAVMFYLKDFSTQNSGHSKKWQTICETLSQKQCDRYANQHDILIEKTSF